MSAQIASPNANAAVTATVELILAEQDHLRRVARRLVRCEADADDLVQDTILRAFRARARFQPGTSIRAWTTTILRRVFLTDAIRTKRRGLETDTDAGEPLERVVGQQKSWVQDGELDLAALSERLDGRVKRSLDRVPEIYRLPFILSVCGDLTCAEIAHRLGVPEGTVMSRIHRARERLKSDLVYDQKPVAAAAVEQEQPAKLRVLGSKKQLRRAG
jgi:RNA polymerase sigma-70 factor (ECF subfamily)